MLDILHPMSLLPGFSHDIKTALVLHKPDFDPVRIATAPALGCQIQKLFHKVALVCVPILYQGWRI
jgi:hypothetical protein